MVGKNNHVGIIKANLDQHYKAYKAGRTWVYASIASLAMGVGLLLGSTTSYADTAANANSTQEPAKSESDASSTAAATSQKASVVPLKTTQNAATAANKADVSAESNVPSSAATSNADKVAANSASNSGTAATSDAQTANNTQENTATTTTESSVSDKQTAANEQANQSVNDSTSQTATQAPQSKVLVDPTAEQLDAAKQSATQVYADTHEPQEIKAVADDSTDAAPLTISVNAVGYGTNEQGALTLTLTVNAKAGDVYAINIPASTPVYGFNPNSVQTMASSYGTTVVDKNKDGSYTVTDTFTNDVNLTQTIPLSLNSNYLAQPTSGMADVGKTLTKTITYSINGGAQTPITFTQTIQPTTNLTPVTMVNPDPKTVTNLIPGKDYVFSIGVNEADGVLDNGSTSARVNSADNYGGTQITIPVPADFTLDAEGTSEMNVFDDQTTITQPGGKGTDVIINVPKGSGSQNYQNMPAYKFVGSFDIAQTAVNQTYTADGDVTFSQVINSDGDTLTDTAAPWSVVILANNGGTDIGKVAAVTSAMGNSSVTDDKLVLDNDASDDPAFLNSFGFTYDSPDDTSDAQIKLTIPDGLNVTSIQTPASTVSPITYLPETASYQYTLTLADGTTQTGTVKAGEQAKVTGNSAIRTAVFVPDKLVPGATDLDSLGSASNFNLLGSLADSYDSGAAVKNDDQLTSTIQFSFVLNGTTYHADSSVTQTVVAAEGAATGWGYETNAAPGAKGAGDLMDIYNFPGTGETTDKIFEPIFYYVIPKSSTVGSTTQMPDAKVSEFVADDGSTVVKFDYTGTGISFDTISQDELGAYATVHLDNKPDALPGDYPYYMYIVSPTTRLLNSTPAVDPSYVENNPDAVLMYDVSNGKWSIDTASALGNSSLALGNQGVEATTTGTSDDQGDATMHFFDTITYTSKEEKPEDDNASVIINLPTIGDAKGSTYTFNLSGPVAVPDNYTVTVGTGTPINPVVLYSTSAQTAADGTTPDTTGYVTADQVKDWSTIRSIAIEINGIKANTSTGRIEITGTANDFNKQAGHTGYLQTIFYGNGSQANVSSTDASIAITGTSTIKTRLHYVDAAGKDQYVDLDDLSKTLNDNADTFTNDYPTQLSDFSTNDQGLIPAGYKLVTDASGKATLTLIDGKDASGKADGTAEFGQVVQYFYDGDIVQYELTSNVSAKIEYVDDDNKGAIVGDPTTVPGVPGGTTDWNTDKLPAGYKLADGQAASGTYEFTGDADQTVKIHLSHVLENSTTTTTRTITYVVAGPNYTGKVPVAQTQTITWKITTDKATGTSFATPTG
ncbi:MAG TPA: hypothetical protein DDW71_04520, partial [Lactobacillus sp.]|nr:hypothetical protein [Lactobacillus sp.]